MLTIGEFSRISKITTKTLRYYDEIELLKPTHVNDTNGYLYYDIGQLKDILLIGRLKLYGFSLEEIADILQAPKDTDTLFVLMSQKQREMEEKLSSYQFILAQMEADIHNLERGISIMSYLDTITVQLAELPAKNILSVRQKINMDDYGKLIGKVYEAIVREHYTPVGAPMSIYHDEEYTPTNYDVEVGVPVKEGGTRIFEGGLHAMAALKGPYSGLSSVYAKIKEWMDENEYALCGAPFEVYQSDPAQTMPESLVTEVYFPVCKK